jgi:SRSO17 transposase
MTEGQIVRLGPAFAAFLACFRDCFASRPTFGHLGTYCRGLMSDLARKSVEPIALAAGAAVRTLQEFLTHHVWDQARMRDEIQRRVARDHLPAPGPRPKPAAAADADADGLGTVGWVDETSVAKKGDKTPGVQRQYCGSRGKVENCLVSVHLACGRGAFMATLDSDLFLPRKTWDADRPRCVEAHIPDSVVYRAKWAISLEQVDRARANGVAFDWMTFDEWYGGKPRYLSGLDARGVSYVGEVPRNFRCFPSLPPGDGRRRRTSRADDAVRWGKPFLGKRWRTVTLARKTLPPQVWQVKAGQVYLPDRHGPTARTYWLIVARNVQTREVKYFVSNAPPRTALATLMRVAFTRAGIEHAFRLAKTEIGFSHYEGRHYLGLMRHMTLCQLVMLFVAEQTDRLRGEKPGGDDGADGAGVERGVPRVAHA